MGIVEDYGYYISIDGGEDFKYDLPSFDTGDSQDPKDLTLFVPVQFEAHGSNFQDDQQQQQQQYQGATLAPHSIRIMSDPHTPFRFEGIMTESTLTQQGLSWADRQDERVTVEFIGEGIDAEQLGGMSLTGGWVNEYADSDRMVPAIQLLNTVQYQAAKQLGVRHWHTSAGVCLIDKCFKGSALPGLQTQYFYCDPLNHTKPLENQKYLAYHFNLPNPQLRVATPSHLVVDLGVADVIIHSVIPETYQEELALFLERLHVDAYPTAHILVVARLNVQSVVHSMDPRDRALAFSSAPLPPSNVTFRSTLGSGPDVTVLRKRLFDATKAAVDVASGKRATTGLGGDGSKGGLSFVPIFDSGDNQVGDFVRALCAHLGPASQPGSVTAQVCSGMPRPVHSRAWVWELLLVAVAVAMAYVARETVFGTFTMLANMLHGGGSSIGSVKAKGRAWMGHHDGGDAGEDLLSASEKGWRGDVDKGKLG